MRKIFKNTWTITLFLFLIIEILGVLFFGGAAINAGINLVFPPVGIETTKEELKSLAYLPLLLFGISVGFMWLAFMTTKVINGESDDEKSILQDTYMKYGNWKIVTISFFIVVTFSYVVRVFGPK